MKRSETISTLKKCVKLVINKNRFPISLQLTKDFFWFNFSLSSNVFDTYGTIGQ
jgi:hypothetical protein